MKNIVGIIQSYNDYIGREGVTEEKINEAEKELKLKFADEYRTYLLNLGIAYANGHEFTGITELEELSVVAQTLRARMRNPKLPSDIYVIENLGIDDLLIWQNEKGELFQTAYDGLPVKIDVSLEDYIKESN